MFAPVTHQKIIVISVQSVYKKLSIVVGFLHCFELYKK